MSEVKLNRKLTLEEPVRVDDGAGGYQTSWQALGTLWGAIEPRTGREAGIIGGSVSMARYRITVRSAPVGAPSRPLAKQRLREGSRLFQIEAVTDSKAGAAYLTCFATEEVAQ